MLEKTAFRTGLCLAALTLGACSWLQQPPAPTQSGQSGQADYGTSAENPYGETAPYTPPGTTTYTPPTTGGAYTPSYAPVNIHATTHTVVRGDTVYNVAKRYQISQDDLRTWNNIGADNSIKVGQNLRVKPAGYVPPPVVASTTPTPQPAAATQPTPTPTQSNTAPVTTPTPASTTATTAPTAQKSQGNTRTVAGIVWQRPTEGRILQNFGGEYKGIDFGGNAGQPVVAAADGKVVYNGSGLRGYGNMIIVQHNQTFLTAYGNNQNLLVNEGQEVKRGQQIATMGNSDAKRTQLHFELRENGQPVDPKNYLPM